ncbi:MAG TPA: hypothetical protein VK357_02090 [Rubrobacteraceae bacterium]|nr:hypothetical protein [Rubrobacteraceae bacterium]
MRTRPLPVTIAAILLVLLSLANFLAPLMLPPEAGSIAYLIIAMGVLGLVAAGGLWMLKGWALWLTVVVSVLNILAAAPGLLFATEFMGRVLATIGVVGFALVILLAVLPGSRRTYT